MCGRWTGASLQEGAGYPAPTHAALLGLPYCFVVVEDAAPERPQQCVGLSCYVVVEGLEVSPVR